MKIKTHLFQNTIHGIATRIEQKIVNLCWRDDFVDSRLLQPKCNKICMPYMWKGLCCNEDVSIKLTFVASSPFWAPAFVKAFSTSGSRSAMRMYRRVKFHKTGMTTLLKLIKCRFRIKKRIFLASGQLGRCSMFQGCTYTNTRRSVDPECKRNRCWKSHPNNSPKKHECRTSEAYRCRFCGIFVNRRMRALTSSTKFLWTCFCRSGRRNLLRE